MSQTTFYVRTREAVSRPIMFLIGRDKCIGQAAIYADMPNVIARRLQTSARYQPMTGTKARNDTVVLDASAVLALVRDESGVDKVAHHVGRAAISAVNLQEVIKELLLSGLDETTIRELLDELRLDVRAHDAAAAYAAAGLHA